MASALKKNCRRYFFMWCEVSLWNSLPQQVRESNTADTLKNGMDNFIANNNIVVIAVGYSGSSRWWYSQCTLIAAGAAKASVSLGSSRENSALSSCPSQPEVCSAPRWLLHLAWEKQLIVYVCSGEGRAGRSSAWAGKFWTILRMCVGHNFRRLVRVHLLSIKMSWQELTARLRLRILVWLFWRSEPDASEENPRNPVVAR